MIRSENDYVIIVYSRYYKAWVSYILRYCTRVMITSEVFRSGRVYSQPRPQGLPRGGARAEEDPGKIR